MSYRPSSTPVSRCIVAHLGAPSPGSNIVENARGDDGEV
jgi:hypothetical protein